MEVKAIVINPETKTLTDIDDPNLDRTADVDERLATIYRLLDIEIAEGYRITIGQHRCFVFFDERGLYRLTDQGTVTKLPGWQQPLVGKLLVVGAPDADGYSTPVPMTADDLKDRIKFVPWSRQAASSLFEEMKRAAGF